MKKILALLLCGVMLSLAPSAIAQVQTTPETTEDVPERLVVENDFYRGRVTAARTIDANSGPAENQISQEVEVVIINGPEKDKEVTIVFHATDDKQRLKVGESVVVNKTSGIQGDAYYVSDRYRMPAVITISLIFFAVAIAFGRKKGLTSIVGLAVSILVLIQFVVPRILAGDNPLLISLIGSVVIALTSLYLAHGFSRRTSIALASTLITLLIAVGFALGFVSLTHLYGGGSEEAFFLQTLPIAAIDLRGLLLGGIIIGVLGVLDDVTTAQVAAVDEIRKANPKVSFKELYSSGISVGQEHIASLVNTLVLAYVGASFPLFLLFSLNRDIQPLWVTINSELIVEEIVRTLVGSIALVFAVPISTFLATYFLLHKPLADSAGHSHKH
jgi:uncharacterized membrane protein